MWSGAWRASFERADESPARHGRVSRRRHDRHPARPLEVPHTFFGVAAKATSDDTGALRQFVAPGHPPRPSVSAARHLQHLVQLRHAVNEDAMRRRDAIARRRSASSCSCSTRAGSSAPARRATSISIRGSASWAADPEPVSVGPRQPRRLRARPRHEIRALGRTRARRALHRRHAPAWRSEAWLATADSDYGSATQRADLSGDAAGRAVGAASSSSPSSTACGPTT